MQRLDSNSCKQTVNNEKINIKDVYLSSNINTQESTLYTVPIEDNDDNVCQLDNCITKENRFLKNNNSLDVSTNSIDINTKKKFSIVEEFENSSQSYNTQEHKNSENFAISWDSLKVETSRI